MYRDVLMFKLKEQSSRLEKKNETKRPSVSSRLWIRSLGHMKWARFKTEYHFLTRCTVISVGVVLWRQRDSSRSETEVQGDRWQFILQCLSRRPPTGRTEANKNILAKAGEWLFYFFGQINISRRGEVEQEQCSWVTVGAKGMDKQLNYTSGVPLQKRRCMSGGD